MGLLDEALDAGERCVCAERVDAHTDRGRRRHGAGHDAIAGPLGNGTGFAGDHRLVQLGFALDDDTVGGDAAAGPNENDIPQPELVERDRLQAGIGDALGFVG